MAALAQKAEAALAALAGRQHGAVTYAQLIAIGFTRHQIQHRIAAGQLIPVHKGVYLVGLGPTVPLAYEAAAILACAPQAFLSHHTAARLKRLPTPVNDGVHVTVVARSRRSLDGVHVYSINGLLQDELERHEGLPISSPSLTLLDLAGDVGPTHIAKAVNEARVLRIVSHDQLRATIEAHPTRRGARALRKLLDSEHGPKITRSEAERLALGVMRSHGLEPDGSDFEIGPYRVDFWFEREQVAVEVDGYRYHATPKRFVNDRRRAAYLASRGIQIYPLTWRDLGPGAPAAMGNLKQTLKQRRFLR